jgi:hypothetical protein
MVSQPTRGSEGSDPDRISELEARVLTLSELVARLGARLSALEADLRQNAAASAPAVSSAGAADPGPALLSAALPLGGRTLLVLAGAFVLRALTESGLTPGWLGVALGLAYALAQAALAERAGKAGAAASATAHGLSTLLVAFPLLFEVVARFQLVGPAAATAALAAVTAALLLVAHRWRLQALAWMAVAGSVFTALALMFQTDRAAAGAIFLALLGLETAWLGYARGWRGLGWAAAAAADLCALGVAVRSLSAYSEEGPRTAMGVLAVLLALALASLAARTLLLRRAAGAFELAQVAGAVGASLGGAALIAARTPTSAAGFGAAAAACGVAAYVAAFTFRKRRPEDGAGFPFFAGVGALLVLSGTALALDRGTLAPGWAVLAVASAALARRLGRRSLAAHAVAYAWGSAVAGGLVALSLDALLASPGGGGAPVRWEAIAALGASAASAWLAAAAAEARTAWAARLPSLALLLLTAGGAAGVAVAWLLPAVAGTAGEAAGRGSAAAVRTAVLVAAAVLLAWIGRRRAWREAAWLAYGVLAATGVKILAEDLPGGRPAALVVTFGVYGAALLLVPRLRPRPG